MSVEAQGAEAGTDNHFRFVRVPPRHAFFSCAFWSRVSIH